MERVTEKEKLNSKEQLKKQFETVKKWEQKNIQEINQDNEKEL